MSRIVSCRKNHIRALSRPIAGKTAFHCFLLILDTPTVTLHVLVFRLATLYDKLFFVNVFPEEIHGTLIIALGIVIGLRALQDFKGHGRLPRSVEMIEQEHRLRTPYFPRISRRDVGNIGVIYDNAVMAYDLDVGMLFQQAGLVDCLIVNGCHHNIFHALIDRFSKLLNL